MLALASPQRADATALYRRTAAFVVRVNTGTATGTGSVIGDGTLILTGYHVVKEATAIKLGDGTGAPSSSGIRRTTSRCLASPSGSANP